MTPYVDRTLAPGERVRAEARMHWLLWLRAWSAIILFGVVLVGAIYFAAECVRIINTEVALTDRPLILKTGFFNRHTRELELASVETVNLDQSVWGRLFDFGRLSVYGTGEAVWTSPLIAAPLRFRREIEAALASQAQPGPVRLAS